MSRGVTVRQFWLLCCAAIVARVALTATTIGTNDAMFWTTWLGLVKRTGIAASYSYTPMMNHPPPALALMLLLDRLGQLGNGHHGQCLPHELPLGGIVVEEH